jgi:hypothetical protein
MFNITGASIIRPMLIETFGFKQWLKKDRCTNSQGKKKEKHMHDKQNKMTKR